MKLVSVDEMRAIEREADGQGWTYEQMMERAGLGLAEMVHSFYGYEERMSALGLVGSGNNGGDTLVALAALVETGWQVTAYLVRPRPKEDALLDRLRATGGTVVERTGDKGFKVLDETLRNATVLLDGVLGTGIQLPLKEEVAEVLRRVKQSAFCPPVVAVDCPSGVDWDSGAAADECLPAEMTISMAAVKSGMMRLPAFELCGDIQVVDIGLPEGLEAWDAVRNEIVSEDLVRSLLPERPTDGHKGTFGTVTVVGGSLNYTGAVLLATWAAGKVGAGLVQAAVSTPLHAALAGHNPNATWVLLPHQMGAISGDAVSVLLRATERTTAMLVGPGFGLEDCSAEFVRRLLENKTSPRARATIGFVNAAVEAKEDKEPARPLPPMVFDADGLKLLAKTEGWYKHLPSEAVLTPHPGEMGVLTGLEVKDIQADRLGVARRYAAEWGHVVVLKGAFTVIAAPDGRMRVIPAATTALAHAGTGDVLAGMIAGLRGQGLAAFDAATAGCWMHAQAGLAAAEKLGHEAAVQATDVLAAIPEVLAWVWER
ncbi:MAG TPA: NAD(P)H-hydrate dehydratase [Anaerolinea sp.]|nr:NAD(P)H-hydrate dehydratase [Anaerolinea sp.]